MKPETRRRKMMEALGLAEVYQKHEEVKSSRNKVIEIPEDQIQSFRAMQGIMYFLQAPELFKLKVCTHCKGEFLVSRQFVSCCSYTCIKMGLAEIGIDWRKDEDIAALVENVYGGQEPIWIRNIERLRAVLESLQPVS